MRDASLACPCCHVEDDEIVRSDDHGSLAECCECGFTRPATLPLLLAA